MNARFDTQALSIPHFDGMMMMALAGHEKRGQYDQMWRSTGAAM